LRPGALYYYFASKDDLLFALQDEALKRLVEGARRIARSPEPTPERLRALVAFHLEVTLGELGGSVAHLEFGALPPARLKEVVRRRDAYEAVVTRVVRGGVKDGSLCAVDPRTATWWILGALNWTAMWWRPEGKIGPAELAATFSRLMLDGLAAPARRET
jgi:AcrR family transcriptional regulator